MYRVHRYRRYASILDRYRVLRRESGLENQAAGFGRVACLRLGFFGGELGNGDLKGPKLTNNEVLCTESVSR